MQTLQIQTLCQAQRHFFESGETLPVCARLQALKKLKNAIKTREAQILAALHADLGKSEIEGYMCEVGMALSELSFMLRHTKKLAKEKRVRTPMAQFCSKSYQKPVPYGNVLIMSPWNYPFLLTVGPLVDAIAAGNTAIVKPSAYSPATSAVIAELIAECFPSEYVAVVTGGRAENAALLSQKFDMIFFTGSQNVGKEVLRAAAEHLTPAVLELGGKSPCIVDESADVKLAARRIVFGKFLNCGQTCVAPDYILCQKSVKSALIKAIRAEIGRQFGQQPLKNKNYGKIITPKHFARLCDLIDLEKVVCGGELDADACRIAPTVMDRVTFDDAVMQEEIFGPILPILTFDQPEEIPALLANKPKPLALYLFSTDKHAVKLITSRVRYGGGCINDVVIHLATDRMGFGGVGESGMGAYHGKVGFDTFSHTKSIVHKRNWIDLPMRYQPYKKGGLYERLLRFFLK